jgi:hypothetical protein
MRHDDVAATRPGQTGAVPRPLATTSGPAPPYRVGEAIANTMAEMLLGATVERHYAPADGPQPVLPRQPQVAAATGPGPTGWLLTLVVRLDERVGRLARPTPTTLSETVAALPRAGVVTAHRLRPAVEPSPGCPLTASLRRALRDALAAEVLGRFLAARLDRPADPQLVEETIEYLVELSGSRVESHDLTHGVVITDVLAHEPRLELDYPRDVRTAKRAPLLFDGLRSLLVVDPAGRARTELQGHRLDHLERLGSGVAPQRCRTDDPEPSGTLVAEATRRLGGLGFFLRADRTIWAFVDGQPLLVRRGEHWMTFPLQLASSIEHMIGGGSAALIVARAAFAISGQRRGAILAVAEDGDRLDGAVSPKDRYDLRHDIDPLAMRPETRLHHLIDAADLDEHTLARLAALDGATIIDRDARLLAYGAIVASADSEHEGARTAAAKTLSTIAEVVLKVSADGEITIFSGGEAVATLLGRPSQFEL